MSKQTSIEYLIKAFQGAYGDKVINVISEQVERAKEMHKQELKECAETFEMCYYNGSHNGMTFEEYYNEIYGGKDEQTN